MNVHYRGHTAHFGCQKSKQYYTFRNCFIFAINELFLFKTETVSQNTLITWILYAIEQIHMPEHFRNGNFVSVTVTQLDFNPLVLLLYSNLMSGDICVVKSSVVLNTTGVNKGHL